MTDTLGRAARAAATAAILVSCSPPAPPPAPGGNSGGPQITYREKALESTEIVEAPETGIELGWGWDSFDSRPVPTVCIEFAEKSEPAQARRMSMREVSDSYELMESLGMSAEASVKAIGVEVSGKASFAKELNLSSFASNFVLNASVDNGVRFVAPIAESAGRGGAAGGTPPTGGSVRLTSDAASLARRDADEFLHRCGNAFVSAVYGGAQLTAVLTIETTSFSEQEELAVEMSASGWGARFEGSLEDRSQETEESERLDLSIFQVGGRGDAIPTSKDDLLDKMKDLSALAFDAPKTFRVALTPYETLPNWPAEPLVGQEREFEELASTWGGYNTLYDEIQQVLDDSPSFQRVGPRTDLADSEGPQPCLGFIDIDEAALGRLAAAQDEVLARLVELKGMALGCSDEPDECTIDTGAFRSPYAYRALLPVPDGAFDTGDAAANAARYHLADTAKRRCARDVRDPGCLSNAEIAGWAEKEGMLTVAADPAVAARIAARGEVVTCDGVDRPAYSAEPGQGVLWYDESRAGEVEALVAAGGAGD